MSERGDLRKYISGLSKSGWVILGQNKHIRMRKSGVTITVSVSASDWRFMKNLKRQVRDAENLIKMKTVET